MDPKRLIPGDATLIENIGNYLKAKGIFDEFRHECLADVDTKSSCQNLSQRVDGYTSKFLANETWHPDLNKNELRNKLRRNLDESGMLAVGADHVVEQVINPKIHQLFLPKIREVVHQYIKEQNELLNKKPETTSSDNTSSSEKAVFDTSDNKVKTPVADAYEKVFRSRAALNIDQPKNPIADILSFSYSKSKPTPSTSTHVKTENTQQKYADFPKVEKKKEEKPTVVTEKSAPETTSENSIAPASTETKMQIDKEKEIIKKEEQEFPQEVIKKAVKEDVKLEKKKSEDVKAQSSEMAPVEENKANVSTPTKPSITIKKDTDKTKLKSKSSSAQKSPISSSEIKKPKKEMSDKPSEKLAKSKPPKSSKESPSPTKSVSSIKFIPKEEKGESSKSKSSDSSSSKTSESSVKKLSKSISTKKESSSKQKGHSEKSEKIKTSKSTEKSDPNIHCDSSNEKTDKSKISKSSDKSDQNTHYDSSSEKTDKSKISKSSDKSDLSIHYDSSNEKSDKSKTSKSSDKSDQSTHYDSSNSEKVTKSTHYSSSYDSSQGSDQEKSSSSSSKKERQKHFYKHAEREKSEEHADKKNKTSFEKRRPTDDDESPSKKSKSEKNSKLEKLKDATVVEAAKINSRSNSFGSTSSVGSSSNTSKDNLASNSDEMSESSVKDKKKKQVKDSCHNPTKELPPPPPPPPSSSSLLCEPTSSAEMSSVEDTQSSSSSESSGSEEMNRTESSESSSESDFESKDSILNTLEESVLNSSTDSINRFYDIFLYSSSSSEFEGFEKSPKKKKKQAVLQDKQDSDISVSSVHTSDLSSYDDELSDDDFSFIDESHLGERKRLTLKKAQELIQNRAVLFGRSKNSPTENKPDVNQVAPNNRSMQNSTGCASSDEEASPSEPKRSLRRERKLNPRYASSEYTSIFNSRKETFITKQSTPVKNNSSYNSSPNSGRKESSLEKGKFFKKSSVEAKINAMHQEEAAQLQKDKHILCNSQSIEAKESSDISGISSSDEMDSIMNKEIFQENDKPTENDHLKNHFKLKLQNSSKLNVNSYSLKRKLSVTESTPVKRPCSRSSVDSSSSEFVPNENKPFNSEKQNTVEDKLRDGGLKGSDLTEGIKKDLFCKQRTNNNGDILGQKDIFPKNSHGKTISVTEKKTNESETSKELNAL